ncbi:hypothetical protein Bca4012_093133 [Brassica carinata]
MSTVLINQHLHHSVYPSAWLLIVNWLHSAPGDRFSLLALLQIWQAAIYVIWHEGNARMHSGLTISHDAVADKATALADDKCRAMTSLGSLLGPLLLNVWMS